MGGGGWSLGSGGRGRVGHNGREVGRWRVWATEAGVSAREATRGQSTGEPRPWGSPWRAVTKGLVIQALRVTMGDRLESGTYRWGHEGGMGDGETRARRRGCLPARRVPAGGGLLA